MKYLGLCATLILASCAPRVSVDLLSSRPKDWNHDRIAVVQEGTELPSSAVKLGEVRAEGHPLSASNFNRVLGAAAEEVWKQGGNVLHVTESHKSPTFVWKGHNSVKGNMLYVPRPDSLVVSRYVNTVHTWYPLEKRTWEVSLGVNWKPLYSGALVMDKRVPEDGIWTRIHTCGMVSLQAAWQFDKRWALIGSLGYSYFDNQVEDYDGLWRCYGHGNVFTAFVGMRYYYFSRPTFKFYSAAQTGVFFHSGEIDREKDGHWGGQVTFLGMQFGRKWFLDWEMYGFGDYYTTIIPLIGGKIGIGYRF